MAVDETFIPAGPTGILMDATEVTQTDGTKVVREVVVQGDPEELVAYAKVTRTWPSIDAYGTVVHPILNKDAFDRLRVSNPVTLFDSQFQYDKQPFLWNEDLTNGTATHLPNESAIDMVADANAEIAVRQTRAYHRYQPGKSQLILMAFVMDGTVASLTRRTKTSGTVSDSDNVAQANWNIDPMDGTGPSGITLDFTKAQQLAIDLEWLSVGAVLVSFVLQRRLFPVHMFTHANILALPYMTTANLPVRYEVEHTGGSARERVGYFDANNGIFLQTTGGAGTLKQICCSVISEGGFETERGIPNSAATGVANIITVGTAEIPLLSIRPAATFNSIANTMQFQDFLAGVTAQTKDIHFRVRHNATTLTGASWAAVDTTHSGMEMDIAATAVAGGGILDEETIVGTGGNRGSGGKFGDISKIPMGFDIDGSSNPDTLTITGQARAASGLATASFHWVEIR